MKSAFHVSLAAQIPFPVHITRVTTELLSSLHRRRCTSPQGKIRGRRERISKSRRRKSSPRVTARNKNERQRDVTRTDRTFDRTDIDRATRRRFSHPIRKINEVVEHFATFVPENLSSLSQSRFALFNWTRSIAIARRLEGTSNYTAKRSEIVQDLGRRFLCSLPRAPI